MFSRQPKETDTPESIVNPSVPSEEITTAEEFQEIMANVSPEESESDDTEITSAISPMNQTNPEIVTIVEKISNILSPYFIVLVGLFLYKSNVFLGTILIIVGILSLLKISWKDMTLLWKKLKETFNAQDTDFTA
ncbi:MAG: hypothetical protein AB4041_17260 [Microcystaceae cyanobacterium]